MLLPGMLAIPKEAWQKIPIINSSGGLLTTEPVQRQQEV